MPDIQEHTKIVLAQNSSATSTVAIWGGGLGAFSATATWGGGSVKLETQTINGTWVSVGADTTLTADGIAGFILPKGAAIRAAIATATAVNAFAIPLE